MSVALQLPPRYAQQEYSEVVSHEVIRGKKTTLHLLKSINFMPPRSQITSITAVPITHKGNIVAVTLKRGLDIPGGHIEPFDVDVIAALQRETYEEACITLAAPIFLIGVIASNYDPEDTTYMLMCAARVGSIDEFSANFESVDREIVTTLDFLNRYSAGPKDMMSELLKRAEAVAPELPPYSTHKPSSLHT